MVDEELIEYFKQRLGPLSTAKHRLRPGYWFWYWLGVMDTLFLIARHPK